jgi:hypothetical protein
MGGWGGEEVVFGRGGCGVAGYGVFEGLEVLGFHGGHEVNTCDDKNEGEDDEGDETADILAATVFLGAILAVLGSSFEFFFVLSLVDVGACVIGSHVFKSKRLYKFYIN